MLRLTLAPGEQFYVNGVLLLNGERRTVLLAVTHGNIMRVHEMVSKEDADKSERHQLAYQLGGHLAGTTSVDDDLLGQLLDRCRLELSCADMIRACHFKSAKKYYQLLKLIKPR